MLTTNLQTDKWNYRNSLPDLTILNVKISYVLAYIKYIYDNIFKVKNQDQ